MAQLTIEQLREGLKDLEKTSQPAEDGALRTVKILVKDIFGTEETSQKGTQFQMIHVEYRDLTYNSLQEKKSPIFLKDQAEVLLGLEVGKTYDISQIKEKGFWKWTGATEVTE